MERASRRHAREVEGASGVVGIEKAYAILCRARAESEKAQREKEEETHAGERRGLARRQIWEEEAAGEQRHRLTDQFREQKNNYLALLIEITQTMATVDRSVNQQLAGLAQQFLSAYHSSLLTQNVPQLSSLYGHDSVFCLDGQTAQGADISAQVIAPRLAPGPIRVKVSKTDVQQAKGTGQVLIFVTGEADARPVSLLRLRLYYYILRLEQRW